MIHTASLRRKTGIVFAAIIFVTLISLLNVHSQTLTKEKMGKRPDIVVIDMPPDIGSEKMPAVHFEHDLHTQALKNKKDCSACHLKENNAFRFKFKRLKDTSKDMDVYHDNCIGCHKEMKDSGQKAGPIAGECRACHTAKPETMSSWNMISFDRSLHYRHESSKSIRPRVNTETTNCSACHHKYDKAAQKTYYKKGEEESCFYCHLEKDTKEARSISSASHQMCVNCHEALKADAKQAGPVNCQGCHDLTAQKKYKVVKDIPRLQRNQPDVAFLSAGLTNPSATTAGSDAKLDNQMNPVAFNHLEHEKNVANCRSCHHNSIQKCNQCHTEKGIEKGGFITLEQSMHQIGNQSACIGCHKQNQTNPKCIGCHIMMPAQRVSDATCNTCHSIDKTKIGKLPISDETKLMLAKSALDNPMRAAKMISDDIIPEKVTIGIMSDQYEPVKLPHRQIVRKLISGIKNNDMANVFHSQEMTICAGCHHHSPLSLKPPKCASCHSRSRGSVIDGSRPELKGAYHGQCMTCHKNMKIKEPAATDCTTCHKKRT